jgi:hypothetical protein
MVELVKNADSIFDDLCRQVEKIAILPKRLNILPDAAVPWLSTLPLDSAHVEQMTEFLYAVRVQAVQRRRRAVRANVTLNRGNQFIMRLVPRKTLNFIRARDFAAALDSVYQRKGPRF